MPSIESLAFPQDTGFPLARRSDDSLKMAVIAVTSSLRAGATFTCSMAVLSVVRERERDDRRGVEEV